MSQEKSLLVVTGREPREELLRALTGLAWQVRAVPDLGTATGLLRTRRFDIGLLFLDDGQPEAARQFEACVAARAHCDWVGVFPRGEYLHPPWRDLVLTHFFDCHTHPADLNFLCQTLAHAWDRAALRALAASDDACGGDMGMVGDSPALRRLRTQIRKAGATDAPVLVAGESGTGKELVARALHAASCRARGPFVAVNCGALPPTLVHSELFGHQRGAFSGAVSARHGLIEQARGGTLFLDEIAELPLETQATLLRFLQELSIVPVGSAREVQVDTRVIAASHVDLEAAVAAGSFRDDLFFRLNVLRLDVPPLRERRDDIPRLARHVHAQAAAKGATTARGFHCDAMTAMVAYRWPGNVRELFNRVQRAAVMCEQPVIRADDLGLSAPKFAPADDLHDARTEAEKCAIRDSLERVSHNVTLAARELGVSRMTLYRLMAKHRITPRGA